MWRKTPQTALITSLLSEKGHASNQDLAAAARKTMPTVTNTTVHRITARLVEAGMASYAPSLDHVKVVDANTKKHDHFLCQACGRLIDINVSKDIFDKLQGQIPGPVSRRNILVAGVCENCE